MNELKFIRNACGGSTTKSINLDAAISALGSLAK